MYIDAVSVVTLKGSRSKQPDLASGYLPVGYSIDSHLTRQVNSQCLWHYHSSYHGPCTQGFVHGLPAGQGRSVQECRATH